MTEFITELLMAVITAAVPVLTAYAVVLIRKVRDKAAAQTDSIKQQDYIKEIADAISMAVAMTSQTYVDSLKKAGSFDKKAQTAAVEKALATCAAAISPAAAAFIEQAYGDAKEYLTARIEAEVRKQKVELSAVDTPAAEKTTTEATAIAASTAAATAATIAQTAIQQISAEPSVPVTES